MRTKYVNSKDCIPMIELEREFYDHSNFLYLKRTIERDGFKPCYPVRAIFNRRKDRYEVFDGIHRVKVAQNLGITKIPLIDETGVLTRQQAIVEGIKANKTHAAYNPMDQARHLDILAKSFSKRRRKRKSVGRPQTRSLSLLAEATGMSENKVSQYLQLLRLPKSAQKLVGEGKLRFSHALVLLKLEKTPSEHMIPQLAEETSEKGWSYRELNGRVEAIRRRGYYQDDTKLCVGCKRPFARESMSNISLCPECIGQLRSGKLGQVVKERKNRAMKKYLRFRHLVEEAYTKEKREIPSKVQKKLEILHNKWRGA